MQCKYQTVVAPFPYGPILPQRSHFIVGLWWATGPTLPWYYLNFTPDYGVKMICWFFSVLLKLIVIIMNWNPFQRWLSEVASVSWHTNFISWSYGRGIRARFVIYGCLLPQLTIYRSVPPAEDSVGVYSKELSFNTIVWITETFLGILVSVMAIT